MKIEIEIYQRPSFAKGWYWRVHWFPIGINNQALKIPLESSGYSRTQKGAEKDARKTVELIKKSNSSKTNSYTIDLSEE